MSVDYRNMLICKKIDIDKIQDRDLVWFPVYDEYICKHKDYYIMFCTSSRMHVIDKDTVPFISEPAALITNSDCGCSILAVILKNGDFQTVGQISDDYVYGAEREPYQKDFDSLLEYALKEIGIDWDYDFRFRLSLAYYYMNSSGFEEAFNVIKNYDGLLMS